MKKSLYFILVLSIVFGLFATTGATSVIAENSIQSTSMQAPAADFFQWPWPSDQSWYITQGPHSDNNAGLDMMRKKMSWGSSEIAEVRAAAGGIVTYASSCDLKIYHQNGWGTEYVHIRSSVTTGQTVVAHQKIGIIETTKSKALCGGSATGPHLHFNLLYNGKKVSIIGTTFGGWLVKVQSGYTPTNGKKSMYVKNGVTKYINQLLDNRKGKNPPPSNNVFVNGTSNLYQDQSWGRANLKICASNLTNQTVYVYFYRKGRSWEYSKKATSTCVTFYDLDGTGSLISQTTYYSLAALNQKPNTSWQVPCYASTGHQGLCDKLTRP
ncbi:MAG: M23 family metallopeptidase [Anaerolineaceae bacterium]|nr:M23 family metallopeptidase [Anaerolineaceae bacterium]